MYILPCDDSVRMGSWITMDGPLRRILIKGMYLRVLGFMLYGKSVSSAQFFCEAKAALKSALKVY